MKALATYIMRGRMQAVLASTAFAVLSLLLPPLSYLSGAVVALVTLRKGAGEGLLVAVVSALVMGLLASLSLGGPLLAVVFAGVVWLPILVLAAILRSTVAMPLVLLVAALIAAGAVIAAHAYLGDTVAWWQQVLNTVLGQAMTQQGLDGGAVLAGSARMMTALMASAFFLSMVLSVFIARWWQAMLYNPGGFGTEFKGLRLGKSGAALGVLVLAWWLVSPGMGSLAADLAAVVLTLFSVPGLALVHDWVSKTGANLAWLVGLYILLAIAPQLLMILAVLGFADSGLNLRRYIKVKD